MTAPATPEELKEHRALRFARERRAQLRGLLLLALVLLIASILRAGVRNVFLPGWWCVW